MEDISVSPEGEVSLALGVRARRETTKTGSGQGVLIDYPKTRSLLLRRKMRRGKKQRAFQVSKRRITALWDQFLAKYGHAPLPLHSLRHAGPSRDAYEGYRQLADIRKRGRWLSKDAVHRYSKSHLYVNALSMLLPEHFKEGRSLLRLWGERPMVARQ